MHPIHCMYRMLGPSHRYRCRASCDLESVAGARWQCRGLGKCHQKAVPTGQPFGVREQCPVVEQRIDACVWRRRQNHHAVEPGQGADGRVRQHGHNAVCGKLANNGHAARALGRHTRFGVVAAGQVAGLEQHRQQYHCVGHTECAECDNGGLSYWTIFVMFQIGILLNRFVAFCAWHTDCHSEGSFRAGERRYVGPGRQVHCLTERRSDPENMAHQ